MCKGMWSLKGQVCQRMPLPGLTHRAHEEGAACQLAIFPRPLSLSAESNSH